MKFQGIFGVFIEGFEKRECDLYIVIPAQAGIQEYQLVIDVFLHRDGL